jgi:signal transduction histidine kinase
VHDLSLYLLDILENSVRAGASVIAVAVDADPAADRLTMTIEDDGPGLPVSPEQVLDPFYTTKAHKKTGLGLSLFRQAAEGAGGALSVGRSPDLGGVAVRAEMSLSDVDRPPLGDVATSLLTMVATNPGIDFRIELGDGDEHTSLRGSELPQRLPELVAFQQAQP